MNVSGAPPPGRVLFPSAEPSGGRTAPWRFSWYVLWRVLGAILIVFIVLTAAFVAVEVLPADPTSFFLPRGCRIGSCVALRQQIIAQWGLDQPLPGQYRIFVTNILTGNFGVSITLNPGTPVWNLVEPVVLRTLALVAVTLLLVAIIALALGLLLARRRGSVPDAWVTFALTLPLAATIPAMAFVALYTFVIRLQWVALPRVPPLSFDPSTLGYDTLLLVALLGSLIGLFAWLIRDYPLSPPALGLPPPGDWRPSRPPRGEWARMAVAKFFAAVPALMAWSVAAVLLTEMTWNVNGLGLLLWNAFVRLDTMVVLAIALFVGLAVVLPLILVADLIHEWLAGTWIREDGRSVQDFQVDPRDLGRGLRALLNNATAFAGIVLVLILVARAIAAPYVAGPYPTALNLSQPNQPPSAAHALGTDAMGRDVLTLLLYGAIPAVGVALAAFTLALMAGLAVVAASGLLGHRVDVFVAIPLDVAIVVSFVFTWIASFVFPAATVFPLPALLPWPLTARILQMEIRGLVPARKVPPRFAEPSPFTRTVNLVWRTGPLVLGNALLAAALSLALWGGLTAIGVGAVGVFGPTPTMGWGQILLEAYYSLAFLRGAWWVVLPPAFCILGAVLAPLLLSLGVKRALWGGIRLPGRTNRTSLVASAPEPAAPPR